MANEPVTTSSPPQRNSTVTLREITEHNWRATADLRVSPAQEGNLAQNPMSMLEAHYSEDAWMRAVYADETPIGFLMMAIWPPTEGYYIWRFMIDQRHQQHGYGRAALMRLISHVKDQGIRELWVGYNRENKVAERLYISLGFEPQGLAPWGEFMARLDLQPTT